MKRFAGAVIGVVAWIATCGPASAGHEVAFYPSYYPQEIRIETVAPTAAATALRDNKLHAYIGATPGFAAGAGKNLKEVDSLGALVVLNFNPADKAFADAAGRCGAAREVLAALPAGAPEGVVFSPYPVTPYHPDYLDHLDRVQSAKVAARAPAADKRSLRLRAKGWRARALVRARWPLHGDDWDLSVDEVPVVKLVSGARFQLNGWPGPPWIKEGWFQAYLLLAPALSDAQDKRVAGAIFQRLLRGDYRDAAERANLGRRLIEDLTRGCDRVVVGYTLRREFYHDDYSDGVENVAFDALQGLNSAVFIRTVKLKDFPWNGWLRLGINAWPRAAWNPVAGFSDAVGRLVWSTLADPALIPLPYNGEWIPNRAHPSVADRPGIGGFEVPADALVPEPGSGVLEAVGKGRFSAAKVVYRVTESVFQDGTKMTLADLLYPYVFAYRWGAKTDPADRVYDPAVAASSALIRGRLAGVRVVRIERKVDPLAPDVTVRRDIPVVEVYIDASAADPMQLAAIAPPWSAVPWHLLALMETAVERGYAAFSKAEAARQGVAWLDLARDRALLAKLEGLIDEFEREGYRPAALRDRVSAAAARLRWRSLRKFAETNGHLLVTNGPYRLRKWSREESVFQVVRELTYPAGLGSFNRFVDPPRALITQVKREANRVVVAVDVESTVKVQRSTTIVREHLRHDTTRGLRTLDVVMRYLVVGADGAVIDAGDATWADDGRFVVELPQGLPRGHYAILMGVYPAGNAVEPAARVLRFTTPET